MRKAWLETWIASFEDVVHDDAVILEGPPQTRGCDVAKLAAAAPDLVRVLLEVEWNGARHDDVERVCPDCTAYSGRVRKEHREGCALNATLTKAGFPTQQSREDAREVLRALATLKERGGV